MNISEKIIQLNTILEKSLLPLVNGDYVYLDFPYHFNIGDMLITKGSLNLLNKSPYKCLYKSSAICIDLTKIPVNAIIILQGGGNFGDIYRGANDFRNYIIEKFPCNKIIIFPQTVFYSSQILLEKDISIYNRHHDLTIIARDEISYNILKNNFTTNKVLLLPDTATYINAFKIHKKQIIGSCKDLYLVRRDRELGIQLQTNLDNFDIYDWPDVLRKIGFKYRLIIHKTISKIRRNSKISTSFWNSLQNIFTLRIIHPYCINHAVKVVKKYNKIYSTRLHGGILAALLNKPFVMLDNSYGKNSCYLQTWFSGVDGIEVMKKNI